MQVHTATDVTIQKENSLAWGEIHGRFKALQNELKNEKHRIKTLETKAEELAQSRDSQLKMNRQLRHENDCFRKEQPILEKKILSQKQRILKLEKVRLTKDQVERLMLLKKERTQFEAEVIQLRESLRLSTILLKEKGAQLCGLDGVPQSSGSNEPEEAKSTHETESNAVSPKPKVLQQHSALASNNGGLQNEIIKLGSCGTNVKTSEAGTAQWKRSSLYKENAASTGPLVELQQKDPDNECKTQ
jgi:hypothetical protein